MNIIKSNLRQDNISKIYHVSDIHIRNLTRHSEYEFVLNNLYNYIKSTWTSDSIIVLTGDILHSKLEISPEGINFTYKFLKNLCDIGNVIMIPGNHDMNLNNSTRIDALSPIVNAMCNNNLHYIFDTSIVNVANVNFYHWAVWDSTKNYIQPIDTSNINICLFHGVVDGSYNCEGHVIESAAMKASNFDKFDFTLLGDIHKTQFYNEEKTIGMVGSLIQQNHGEDLVHGIFVWDIINKNVEFVEIENNTQFYTVYALNGEYTIDLDKIKDNVYLRIIHNNTKQEVLDEIKKYVGLISNVIEVTYSKVKFDSNKLIEVENHKINLEDNTIRNKLMVNYLKDEMQLDSNIINKIIDIDNSIASSITKTETNNSIWNIKYFKFENMFSYGVDNYIDFENISGTYGIFAKNAEGKSSIIDSIVYCLFDKCTKTSKASLIMNNKSDTFNCELSFVINGDDYIINRTGRRQKNGNVRVDVNFYKINNGEEINLSGVDRFDTNKKIIEIVGDYDTFILTHFSTQSYSLNLIDMGQKDRKDVLNKLLNISIFDKCNNVALDLNKHVKYDISKFNVDYDSEISKETELINKLNYSNELILNDINGIEQVQINLNTELKTKYSSLREIKINLNEGEINQRLQKYKSEHDTNFKLIENYKIKLSEYHVNINKCNIELEKYNNVKNNINELNSLNENILKNNSNLNQLNQELTTINKKLSKLDELKYDVNCNFCMDNVFVKDAIDSKKQKVIIESNILELNENKLSLDSSFNIEHANNLKYNKYIEICEYIKNLQNKIDSLDKDILILIKTNEILNNNIIQCNSEIDLIKHNEVDIKHNSSVNSSILEIESKIKSNNILLKSLNSDVTSNKILISKSINCIENHNLNKTKYYELLELQTIYSIYLQVINRNGLPSIIISNILPDIESEVNSILSQIVNFKIKLDNSDGDINISIMYGEGNTWPIELVSGMERFITSMSFRCALMSISTLPKSNFLAIDEGLGVLDSNNLTQFNTILQYIKELFKFVFIISHIDVVRDYVDNVIEINKLDNKSVIKF